PRFLDGQLLTLGLECSNFITRFTAIRRVCGHLEFDSMGQTSAPWSSAKVGEDAPAQMSFSRPDHGSELQDSSQISPGCFKTGC
ncbi:hypothetical protein AVEN_134438-1, partial [Araneus ventricosus]